jgi:hypothetical protein
VNKNKRNVKVFYSLNHIKRLGKVKDTLVSKARLAKLFNWSLMQVAFFHFAGWWNTEGMLLMAFLAQACTTTISSTAVLALFPKRQELSTNRISTVCADIVVVDAHDEFVIVVVD